jgi:flagellar hook-basal body complex protein FliE
VQEAVRESKAEPMDIAQEKETREETHPENATFEGETADFPSLQQSSSNESAQGVHDTPEAVLDSSGSRDEPIDIVDEEIREETYSESAPIASTLGEKTEDLPNSKQSSSEESAHVLEKKVQDTPEAVLDYGECKAEPMDIVDEKETRDETHSVNAAIASTLKGEAEDLPSPQQLIIDESARVLEKEVQGVPGDVLNYGEHKAEPVDIKESKEEEYQLDDAAFASTLEREIVDLLNLQQSSSEESARASEKEMHDTPEASLDYSESRAEPVDTADEEETREGPHSDNAVIASTAQGETMDPSSSQQSSIEESAHVLEKELQDTPEAVLDYSDSKTEAVDIADEMESREESQLDDAAFASTLEREIVDLVSLQQSSSEESAHALEKEVQDTPEVVLDYSESKAEPMDSVDAKETSEETHSDNAAIASTLERETEDLPSSFEPGKYSIQLHCESNAPGGVCTVNIVGTAHVLKASCEEVEACIRHVKPEVVFLELCSKRTDCLFPSKLKVPTFSNMLESYKKKEMNLFGLLYAWYLAKVGEKLEVIPGSEFRIAYEEALKCGASVVLGDRPVEVTLKRTWGKLSLWHKTHFIVSALTGFFYLPSLDDIHALLEQSDELTRLFEELGKTYPLLHRLSS